MNPSRSTRVITCAALLTAGMSVTVIPHAIARGSIDRLVYTSTRDGNTDVWAMNVDGTEQNRLTTVTEQDVQPDVSPNGKRVAFIRGVAYGSVPVHGHLWIMDADGSNPSAVFKGPKTTEYRPDFSPDGDRILFSRFSDIAGTAHELWVVNTNGTGATRVLANANYGSWSPDGTKIVHNGNVVANLQIWVSDADGSDSRELTSIGRNVAPQWSPDGTRIAFTSFRNGDGEVWVMNADGTDQHVVVASPGKDGLAAWSPDNRRIAFASTRHTACPAQLTETCPHRIYTIAADGSDLRLVADNALTDLYPAYFPPAQRQGRS